ncbi:hypothetical protein BC332_21299 [Capsicum chinense]|nr:hypothetical protein BC332_21299 [Capsicum chinense]
MKHSQSCKGTILLKQVKAKLLQEQGFREESITSETYFNKNSRSFRGLIVKDASVVSPKYTSIKPLGDRVPVKIKDAKEKSVDDILLPTSAQSNPQGGGVVVVGKDDIKDLQPLNDTVLIKNYLSSSLKTEIETVGGKDTEQIPSFSRFSNKNGGTLNYQEQEHSFPMGLNPSQEKSRASLRISSGTFRNIRSPSRSNFKVQRNELQISSSIPVFRVCSESFSFEDDMIIATFTIQLLDGVSWRHVPSNPYSVQLEAFRLDVRLDIQISLFSVFMTCFGTEISHGLACGPSGS